MNSHRCDSRRHDILWRYNVNKYRAMRGNRSELAPARKSPRCPVNIPYIAYKVNLRVFFLSSFLFRDARLAASKLSGPVNGDECYFWRTTGCYFEDKCRFRHLPASKGIDLKKVEAKYGGKLRVTPPGTDSA